MSVRLTMSRTLPGPPEVVWDLITDWENQGDWMLEATDFQVTSPMREGVGVEAVATVRIGGLRTRDAIRVIAWDPPRLLGIQHMGWVKGVAEVRLTRLENGSTRADWTEELHPPLGLLGDIGVRLFKPIMVRVFSRDLRVLEGLVRARSRS